jgi:hypothetical protein
MKSNATAGARGWAAIQHCQGGNGVSTDKPEGVNTCKQEGLRQLKRVCLPTTILQDYILKVLSLRRTGSS